MIRNPRVVVVVAGVSGSGKTTIGRMLSRRLGAAFLEGDDLHSAENIAKMTAGVALDDFDRAPWLRAIATRIDGWLREGRRGIVACSALKRAYRDVLTKGRPDVFIVVLQASAAVIAERLESRQGHFMPRDLLASQLATLEPPRPGEKNTISLDASGLTPAAIVETIVAALAKGPQHD